MLSDLPARISAQSIPSAIWGRQHLLVDRFAAHRPVQRHDGHLCAEEASKASFATKAAAGTCFKDLALRLGEGTGYCICHLVGFWSSA